jgi:hypothetical protein
MTALPNVSQGGCVRKIKSDKIFGLRLDLRKIERI